MIMRELTPKVLRVPLTLPSPTTSVSRSFFSKDRLTLSSEYLPCPIRTIISRINCLDSLNHIDDETSIHPRPYRSRFLKSGIGHPLSINSSNLFLPHSTECRH